MNQKRFSGRFLRVAGTVTTVSVDCSHWSRDSTLRSTGKMVRIGQTASVASAADQPHGSRLELVVTFTADAPPNEVWQQVNRLLQAATMAAPDLKLTYDAMHSRAENGDLVIALLPEDMPAASQQLGALTMALRAAAGAGIEIRAVRVAA